MPALTFCDQGVGQLLETARLALTEAAGRREGGAREHLVSGSQAQVLQKSAARLNETKRTKLN